METKKDENLMPEEKKTNRQIWEEAIKRKNPEVDFSDEDVLYALSMKGYDEEHEYRKNNEQKNKEMYELLSANPDVAMFISSLVTDKNVGKAMSYLSDVIGLQEGTPEYEEYQKGVEARKTREAEAQKAVEEYENNLKESADVLKAFADENGMTEEDAVAFVKKITEVVSEKLFSGKIDKEFLDLFFRAFNYETDIETAKKAGKIEGRNEAIETKNKKLKKGDGLPEIKNSAGAPIKEPTTEDATIQTLSELANKAERDRKLFGR